MLHASASAADRRRAFRAGLASTRPLRFPGAFNPLCALLIEELGFDGVYLSGAALAASMGLPDIGLTTLTEVAEKGHETARVTRLPTLVDADTGFGGPMATARSVQLFEELGISGCHLEDQVSPKRCGHLEGKQVVSIADMVTRISAAVEARRDRAFVICARTDARASEGVAGVIARARAYADAGADLIFPEALTGAAEFEAVRKAVATPILANMTEFGKTDLLDYTTLSSLGINVVIYPVTLLRLAMGAVERGLRSLLSEGSQKELVAEMQTRSRLYEILDYDAYTGFESSLPRDRGSRELPT